MSQNQSRLKKKVQLLDIFFFFFSFTRVRFVRIIFKALQDHKSQCTNKYPRTMNN